MRNKTCIFDLARGLKFQSPISATPESMEWAFDLWFEKALPIINTKDKDVSWKDFKNAWRNARTPPGALMQRLADRTAEEPDPPCAAKYRVPAMRRLIKLARELQRINGDKPFPLSARDAKRVGFDHPMEAFRCVGKLRHDGILLLVEKGSPGPQSRKANMYRYIAGDG
jgi:hypothetical protein